MSKFPSFNCTLQNEDVEAFPLSNTYINGKLQANYTMKINLKKYKENIFSVTIV